LCFAGLWITTGSWAADPVDNPAASAAEEESKGDSTVTVPSVEVEAEKKRPKATDRVGEYEQPRWTTRRFSASRVYVNPPGLGEFNYFFTPEFALSEPGEAEIGSEYELEIGLGHRMQFDLYLVTAKTGWDGAYSVTGEKLEFRYAFADWGELWGNPTVYLEWAHNHNSPSAIEPKLLLGGELANKLFGAVNLVYERPLSGSESEIKGTTPGDLNFSEQTVEFPEKKTVATKSVSGKQEFALTAGLTHVLFDPSFYVGVDTEFEYKTADVEVVADETSTHTFSEIEVFGGPSLQWYPTSNSHVGFTGFVGYKTENEVEVEVEEEKGALEAEVEEETESEPLFKALLNVGYEF
jgi:hypothetical protein